MTTHAISSIYSNGLAQTVCQIANKWSSWFCIFNTSELDKEISVLLFTFEVCYIHIIYWRFCELFRLVQILLCLSVDILWKTDTCRLLQYVRLQFVSSANIWYIYQHFLGRISSIWVFNSLELDQTPINAASDQAPSCLQRLLQ